MAGSIMHDSNALLDFGEDKSPYSHFDRPYTQLRLPEICNLDAPEDEAYERMNAP